MAKKTRKQLLTAALLARGYTVGTGREDRSTKYVTFVPHEGARVILGGQITNVEHRIFVGPAGALRASGKGSVSTSMAMSTRTIDRLLEEGRNANA